MKIVVLAGGLSTERDVSVISGKQVAAALRKIGHKTVLLDVFMGYNDPLDDPYTLFDEGYDFTQTSTISSEIPDIEKIKSLRTGIGANCYFGKNVIKICQTADICFLALHGGAGENGQIQAAFDLMGIKYTGSGYLGSAVAMDKGITKAMLLNSGVPTPNSTLFAKSCLTDGSINDWNIFPCVVKPCSGGSSVGVSIVNCKDDFESAMKTAFSYESGVLVEQYIKGREFSVGVLGSKALPVIEIIPKTGFYDYVNKYQSGNTEEVCPAVLDDDTTQLLQREAEHAYRTLGLKAYARIDFLLDKDNKVYCLEANTLPGMTPVSLLPQEAKADGLDFPQLCDRIVELSMKKYEN